MVSSRKDRSATALRACTLLVLLLTPLFCRLFLRASHARRSEFRTPWV